MAHLFHRRFDRTASASPLADASPGEAAPVADFVWRERSRALSPVARLLEMLLGIIVTLSAVGAVSLVSTYDPARRAVTAGIAAGVAWALVAAILSLGAVVVERHRGRALLAAVRGAVDAARARAIIAESLPPLVAATLRPADLEHVRRQLVGLQEVYWARLAPADVVRAAGIFLVVTAPMLPMVLPLLLPLGPRVVFLASSAVALVLLFGVGYRLGHGVSARPAAVGAAMLGIGAVLVAVLALLGG